MKNTIHATHETVDNKLRLLAGIDAANLMAKYFTANFSNLKV